jgi:hypothetical protein
MNFQAEPVTINTLLSVSKQYFIPRYQREFSWTKDNIEELWSDLLSCVKYIDSNLTCEEYFIGTLVLAGSDESFEVEIVDGQQRLSIITMFISAICRAMNSIGEVRAANSTFDTFIKGSDRRGNEFSKLDKRARTDYFKLLVQDIQAHPCEPVSEEDFLVKDAFTQITKLISQNGIAKSIYKQNRISNDQHTDALNCLVDLIADHLKVIRVNVLNTDDAYVIFEILNARGINLGPVDLIKNKVLQEWDEQYPLDFAKEKWDSISSILSSREVSVNLEDYAVHHWTTTYKYTSKRNLYKVFKRQWVDGNLDPSSYLIDLHEKVVPYMKVVSPQATDWPQADQKPIYNSLLALKVFGVSIMRSFLLSLFTAKNNSRISQRQLIDTLASIENFHFMFNSICSLRPSGIEGLYAKLARRLNETDNRRSAAEILSELTNTLSNKKPTRSVFQEKFIALNFTNSNTHQKKLIQYIFTKIEKNHRGTNEFEPTDLSLEHILSQSSAEPYVGNIGNLLPIGQSLNGDANTADFVRKKEIYSNSDYQTVQYFINENTDNVVWEKEHISQRALDLSNLAYDVIWNS